MQTALESVPAKHEQQNITNSMSSTTPTSLKGVSPTLIERVNCLLITDN